MRKRSQQLELELAQRPRWGGARRGASRKPGSKPRIRHYARAEIRRDQPCHVTMRVRPGLPSLRTPRLVRAFRRSLRQACDREKFRVVEFSIQTNHVHLIVEASDRLSLARGMMAVSARLGRAVNRVFHRSGPVLSDRYHLRTLATPRETRNALAYVLLNGRKHPAERAIRVARAPAPDPASSGGWFTGWQQRVVWRLPRGTPCVAAARSWLLRVGWKSHGLIDLSEIPGGRSR